MGIGSLVVGVAQAAASGIQASQQAQAQKEYVEAQSAEYARAAASGRCVPPGSTIRPP